MLPETLENIWEDIKHYYRIGWWGRFILAVCRFVVVGISMAAAAVVVFAAIGAVLAMGIRGIANDALHESAEFQALRKEVVELRELVKKLPR